MNEEYLSLQAVCKTTANDVWKKVAWASMSGASMHILQICTNARCSSWLVCDERTISKGKTSEINLNIIRPVRHKQDL